MPNVVLVSAILLRARNEHSKFRSPIRKHDGVEVALDRSRIRTEISRTYDAVGRNGVRPPSGLGLKIGAALAESLGYGAEDLETLPAEVLESFVGTAPLHGIVDGGDRDWVLDLGCGSGCEALLLSRKGFRVAALDASTAMLRRLARSRSTGVDPILAELPEIPLKSGFAAWALLNGVANLVPDRLRLLGEVHRVLRPGARLLVADLLAVDELPSDVRELPEAWAWCLGGATGADVWERDLAQTGFCEVQILVLEKMPPVARALIRAQKAAG
jgi:arsenite methyltransferase